MEDKNKEFLTGLMIGGLLGVLVGMVIAPTSGEEAREAIKKKFDNLKDFMVDEVEVIKNKISKEPLKKTVKKSKK